MPEVRDVAMTPMAKAEEEISAMAASDLMRLLPLMRSSKNADSRTTGMATAMGAKFNAVATERAPKPTWDSPSPIIEYRLSTRLTPSSAAHKATKAPASSARIIKE